MGFRGLGVDEIAAYEKYPASRYIHRPYEGLVGTTAERWAQIHALREKTAEFVKSARAAELAAVADAAAAAYARAVKQLEDAAAAYTQGIDTNRASRGESIDDPKSKPQLTEDGSPIYDYWRNWPENPY